MLMFPPKLRREKPSRQHEGRSCIALRLANAARLLNTWVANHLLCDTLEKVGGFNKKCCNKVKAEVKRGLLEDGRMYKE